jgi:hypothetical protein
MGWFSVLILGRCKSIESGLISSVLKWKRTYRMMTLCTRRFSPEKTEAKNGVGLDLAHIRSIAPVPFGPFRKHGSAM